MSSLVTGMAADTGLQVFRENDGTAAAVAELFHGHGRELNDVYVFISTPIGGGVILGGDYSRGLAGNAGDLGLMPVPPSTLATVPKPNRTFDILLTRASISSLIRHLRGSGVAIERRHDLDAAIEGHPKLVSEWLEDCSAALVAPLLSAACLLDVELVVLDGDLPRLVITELVAKMGALLRDEAPESRAVPTLRPGPIGREAAALGGAILSLNLTFSPTTRSSWVTETTSNRQADRTAREADQWRIPARLCQLSRCATSRRLSRASRRWTASSSRPGAVRSWRSWVRTGPARAP